MVDWFVSKYLSHIPPPPCPEDSEWGAWFLTPRRHLVEAIVCNLIFIPVLIKSFEWSAVHDRVTRPKKKSIHDFGMKIFFIALVCSFIVMMIHKHNENKLFYMLQPCHLAHATLLFMYICPSEWLAGQLFNIYLHWLFSPILGMVAADLSCYDQFLELTNWFVQHFLLLVYPLYLIKIKRYPLVSGRGIFWFSYSLELLMHMDVFLPASLIKNFNVNYMVCPPGGILAQFGNYYRPAMASFCIALMFIIRYGLIELYVIVLRDADLEEKPDSPVNGNHSTNGKKSS